MAFSEEDLKFIKGGFESEKAENHRIKNWVHNGFRYLNLVQGSDLASGAMSSGLQGPPWSEIWWSGSSGRNFNFSGAKFLDLWKAPGSG